MSTRSVGPSPELIAAIARTVFQQLHNAEPVQESHLDPDVTSPLDGSSELELPSSEPPRLSSDDERLSAMEDSIRILLERTSHLSADADDEGDGGIRRRAVGYILGERYKDLSSDQKAARNELSRQIRQIMKALTKRSGVPIDDDDNGDANDNLIKRTVEILLGGYESLQLDDSTGHYTCEGVSFNKKDCYFLAATFFENKKRAYQIRKSDEKKKKYERAKRNNRRHLRQCQTKEQRMARARAYKEKYHVELPDEIFQSDFMTELVSDLDSSEISSPSSAESADEGDEILPKSVTRAKHVKARRDDYLACLAAQASLTSTERRRKVKLWEEKKLACRSKKLERIYKRLDKLMDKESEEEKGEETKRRTKWADESAASAEPTPPWKQNGPYTEVAWTKLQQADPVGLDLQINTDSESFD
ncbi:hypothetical protein ACEPAG_3427 [Sanghuangporus baumii]